MNSYALSSAPGGWRKMRRRLGVTHATVAAYRRHPGACVGGQARRDRTASPGRLCRRPRRPM